MKNPIKEIREALKLEPAQLAALSGVSQQTIRWNEKAENLDISPKLKKCLTDMGFDEKQLTEDYAKYREWKKKQLLKQLKEQLA